MRAIRSPRTSGSSKQAGQLRDYFRPEVTVPTAKNVYGCSKEFQHLTQNRSQETDWLQRVPRAPTVAGPCRPSVAAAVTIIWRLSLVPEENVRKQPQKRHTFNHDKFTVCNCLTDRTVSIVGIDITFNLSYQISILGSFVCAISSSYSVIILTLR